MNKFLILIIFLIFGASSVFAQSNPQLTFPIAELGNCNNVQTCKVYCDQPENRDVCISFAKSKGLYKDKVDEKQVQLLSLAKTELGCETLNSCKLFCAQQENQIRCQQFAQKHGLAALPSAKNEELLIRAKQNLNCDSFESCKSLCDQKENYTKCAALLQDQVTADDRAMFEKYKPLIKEHLGCDSLVTCMAFCMNPLNSAKCSELGSKIGGTEQIPNQESPEVWCPKYSSECRWDGTTCICQGPQTCAQSNDIPGCTWDGTQCSCPGIGETPPSDYQQEPPEVWCPKIGQYCAWDGSSCICWDECVKSGGTWTGSSCTPPAGLLPPTPSEPGEVWCPKVGPYCVWDGSSCTCWDACVKDGGTWTGTKCELQTSTSEPPDVSCTRNPDCRWTGESCYCTPVQTSPTVEQLPQVQGVNTNRGLLNQFINFILSLVD
ncbi:hypothetical protein HYS94_00360 [Candidatus Daviesbacteria bacterium]|nr:hypothetical protein [Candidatus Daviesbacteria bacterium]